MLQIIGEILRAIVLLVTLFLLLGVLLADLMLVGRFMFRLVAAFAYNGVESSILSA